MALMPIVAVTTGTAVATNGTLTFAYPARPGPLAEATLAGDYVGSILHSAYAEGLQVALAYQTGFGLTFNATNITFTYLGVSPIPANSVVKLQLDTIGQNESIGPFFRYPGLSINASGSAGDMSSQAYSGPSLTGVSTRVQDAIPVYVNLGSPLTASATAVVNAATRTGVNTITTYATPVTLDVPRTLQYVAGSVGDTTQTVTVVGTDEYNQTLTEKKTLNGTTVVQGTKAFKTIISDQVSASLTTTLSIGSSTRVGLPAMLLSTAGAYVLKEIVNGVVVTTGTFVAADLSAPTNLTGDVRGTYLPGTPFSGGTNSYELIYIAPNLSAGGPQA